jgi:hypothetical protein
MPLYNAASRARHVGSLINRPQGGGEKKAGFPRMIGRESMTSIFLHSTDPNGKCCTLDRINVQMPFKPIKSNKPIWVRTGSAYGH